MTRLKFFASFFVVVCCLSVVYGAAIDAKDEHHQFFRKLSKSEQYALMALAISHHDVPENAPVNSSEIFPVYPPLKPRAEVIPATLFSSMMNGNVPKKWMKEFLNWLRNDFKMDDNSFKQFQTDDADRLCKDGRCVSISDIGAWCCPFG